MTLHVVPITLSDAKDFVNKVHRHHRAPVGHIFSIACCDSDGLIRGVATCGRPVARRLCDGMTVEVNRVATDGVRNGCSFLLGACRRVAFQLGYRRIITYTLPEEGGGSLRGAGWTCDATTPGRSWSVPSRERIGPQVLGLKHRWVSQNTKAFSGDLRLALPGDPDDQLVIFGESS